LLNFRSAKKLRPDEPAERVARSPDRLDGWRYLCRGEDFAAKKRKQIINAPINHIDRGLIPGIPLDPD